MINLSKLKLQFGLSLELDNGFVFRQPTMQDIIYLGEEVYFWFMMTWCKKPQDSIHQLYKMGYDFSKITEDEYFHMNIKDNEELFIQVFMYFCNFKKCRYIYNESEECHMINGMFDDNLEVVLSFDDIDNIKKFISDIHFFKSSSKRKFDDFETMSVILGYELEEIEMDAKQGKNIDISNVVSSVVSRNNRTWDYVFSLTVYRLYDELYRAMKIDEVNQLMNGIYSGNVDGKKIDNSKLSWLS